MRLIVLSDSHRNYDALRRVFCRHMDADLFIHLGDGEVITTKSEPHASSAALPAQVPATTAIWGTTPDSWDAASSILP